MANWVLLTSPGWSLGGHTVTLLCPLAGLLFSLMILSKAAVVLHSHTPWGMQTSHGIPKITGPVARSTNGPFLKSGKFHQQ